MRRRGGVHPVFFWKKIMFFQDDSSEGDCIFGDCFETPHHFRSTLISDTDTYPHHHIWIHQTICVVEHTHDRTVYNLNIFFYHFHQQLNWTVSEVWWKTSLDVYSVTVPWIKTKFFSHTFTHRLLIFFHISSENVHQIKSLDDAASAFSWLPSLHFSLSLCLWLDVAYRKQCLLYSSAYFSVFSMWLHIPSH